MSYIGNGRTVLIFANNVRDDITPDGVNSTFTLSQEVPGGYEENVVVVRSKYLRETLVQDSDAIAFDGVNQKIISTDPVVSAALSLVRPEITGIFTGDKVHVSGAVNSNNNGIFNVIPNGVFFDGNTTEIQILGTILVNEAAGGSITVERGVIGPWEVLEPGIDYTIQGVGLEYNKLITFSEIPQIDDRIYVVHKGDATYNFVPSPNSVGPDQLQHNLRNFVCDRFTGDDVTTQFALSQSAVNSRAIIVTVNGLVSDGDDPDNSYVGDWELNNTGDEIEFHVAPEAGADIRILHLGFSTISRRATLSPGQPGTIPPNSINNPMLQSNSVTDSKILNVSGTKLFADSVDETKILLNNNQALRGRKLDTTAQNLIKINAANNTEIEAAEDLLLGQGGSARVRLTSTSLRPVTDLGGDLGSPTHRWKDSISERVISDQVETNSLTVSGNISVTGTVDGVDVSNLQAQVNALIPTGVILMTARSNASPGFLLCDGSAVSRTTFADLFAAIGTTYGPGDGVTTFNLPDLRQRFPLGRAVSGTGSILGQSGGNIDHVHVGGLHSHNMNHTHTVPGHHHTHNTALGTDLRIETATGTHFHSLNDHTHGINIAISGNHTHDISVNTGGAHNHTTRGSTTESGTNPIRFPRFTGSGNKADFDFPVNNSGSDINNGAHSHTLTQNPSGAHTHAATILGSGAATTDTSGAHTHPSSSFAGRVGRVTGAPDGNNDLTTNSISTPNTDAAGAVATSAANPPFLVINYMIKT
jgi:microcystin-dependent protein